MTSQEKYIRKLIREAIEVSEDIYLYHGTSDIKLKEIMTIGLQNPYLTDLTDKAEYYAIEASEEIGGKGVILKIKVIDKNKLRVDFNELDEPVIIDAMGDREDVWKDIKTHYVVYAKAHPEKYDKQYKTVSIDPKDYYFSLETVDSEKYNGVIPPEYIEVYDYV